MIRSCLTAFALIVSSVGAAAAQTSLSDILDLLPDQQSRPDSFTTLSEQLMPAVVNITTSKVIANDLPMFEDGEPLSECNPFFGRDPEGFSREGALGSGFVIISSADNVLRPILVGRDTGIPDWIILVTTLGGLSIAGFTGIVLGPLVAGLFLASWSILQEQRAEDEEAAERYRTKVGADGKVRPNAVAQVSGTATAAADEG